MKNRLYTRFKNSSIDRDTAVAIVCVIAAISLLSAPVVAQTIDGRTDDFEDQSVEGWEHSPSGIQPDISSESVRGNYSLLVETEKLVGDTSDTTAFEWVSGPTLDLSQEFTVKGTVRPEWESGNIPIRIGLSGDDQTAIGENAFIIFDVSNGETYLSTTGGDEGRGNGTVANSFADTWVNYEIYSAGDGTLEAKVWEYGSSEPTEYQLSTTQFSGETGSFGVSAGGDDSSIRNILLDEITVSGTLETDTQLVLETNNRIPYGETESYTVYDLVGEAEIRTDVTDDAIVSSGNESVLSVDQSANELTATSNENVSTRVNVTATYNGRNTVKQIAVADISIENLEVLHFIGRISAMFMDRAFQMILTSLLLAIAATRVANVFAGLGIYQMGLTAGWFIGWVPIGLAFVGLFTTLFIGLNIAANIDYSVRR